MPDPETTTMTMTTVSIPEPISLRVLKLRRRGYSLAATAGVVRRSRRHVVRLLADARREYDQRTRGAESC